MIKFASNDDGYSDCEHYMQSDLVIVSLRLILKPILLDDKNIANISPGRS